MFKRSYQGAFLVLSIIVFATSALANRDVWQEINDSALKKRPVERQIIPDVYRTFRLNKAALQGILDQAPMEFTGDARMNQVVLTFPMPDGTLARFRIENSPIMEPGLAGQYPEFQTYRGQGIDDLTATVRFDLMPSGFHALILSRHGSIYIDPYSKGDTENYISYHKSDLRQTGEKHICLVNEGLKDPFKIEELSLFRDTPSETSVTNGSQLRTYRLALAADFEYCSVFGTTETQCMAAMTTTMNRVNGVYERDLAIRMVFVANNNLIVYAPVSTNCGGATCTAGTDPYSNSNPTALLAENQANLDTRIGTANYDIGHVFTTGGGGVATLNSPCNPSTKARGETGLPNPTGDAFAIDFVAHEMGHQFGGNHTFNGGTGNCSGSNRAANAAYEPGSGITIMAYAGICGAQDLAANSIDTFHVKSLEEIVTFKEAGGACGPATATGNTPPTVTGPGNFNIPKQTPFALTASASDINGDSITYDWQEYDLGPQTSAIPNDDTDGQPKPIFRPYLSTVSGTRTFPSLQYILNNSNVPPATTGGFLTGERLPTIARTMTFQVIARDHRANGGGINTATSVLTVSGTAGPFNITSQNAATNYQGNSSQAVTWNVAGTSGAPINAANVKISFSTDGGNTFPTVLLASTPNDGSQNVTIPIGNTTLGRIKVEAVGNIFFDINDTNITVNGIAAPPLARADFDGDGKTDLSIYRPSEGYWYFRRSSNSTMSVVHWGISTDQLVPGDYNGDLQTDFAIFRPTNTVGQPDFYILNSGTFTMTGADWGGVGDIPVVGDYDADGKTDYAIFRPSNNTRYVVRSGGGSSLATAVGIAGDLPVIGDFDGDSKTDFIVYRPGVNGRWLGPLSNGGTMNTVYGEPGDILVPADYDNDSIDNIAVFRPSNGNWYYINNSFVTVVTHWGISTDIPVPGDYDGDGADDIAIYRDGTWWINRSTSGILIDYWGVASDKPVPRSYIP